MELKKHKFRITEKMRGLRVTREAKFFYLWNCEMQDEYIKSQQNNGVDPPIIKLDDIHTSVYREKNYLTQRDMIYIVDELEGIGVLDKD